MVAGPVISTGADTPSIAPAHSRVSVPPSSCRSARASSKSQVRATANAAQAPLPWEADAFYAQPGMAAIDDLQEADIDRLRPQWMLL